VDRAADRCDVLPGEDAPDYNPICHSRQAGSGARAWDGPPPSSKRRRLGEVTNSQPEYDDPSKALDDEYIAPGTYTTKGPADQSFRCYWARMSDASGESISANDLTSGRAIVALKEGEFFKTSGCKPWTRSGD
jgi:hypothetical protein